MSHLPVSLMNRLNQTAVFKLWMLYFQRIPYSDYLMCDTFSAMISDMETLLRTVMFMSASLYSVSKTMPLVSLNTILFKAALRHY